jgi:hypothetical protein
MSMAMSFRRRCVLRLRPKAKCASLRFFTAFRMTLMYCHPDPSEGKEKGLTLVE